MTMNPPPDLPTPRQQRLLARSAALRAGIGAELARLETPFGVADHARHGWHWLAGHRQTVAIGLALWVLFRPRRAVRWGLRAWGLWQALRRWRPWLETGLALVTRYAAGAPSADPRRR